MIETPLRTAVALPVSLVIWPMTCAAAAGRRLRVLDVAGERVDDVAGEMGAIGRGDRGALLALEVIVDDELVSVIGQHEIDACALEVAMEQEIGIGNNERALRRVPMTQDGKCIDVVMGGRVETLAMQGERGVKFASVVQRGSTAKRVNI